MRFSLTVSAVLAMAASALAQTADFDPIYTPKSQEVIPAGETYTVTWDSPAKYADDTISIHLIGGATQDTQVPLSDIASNIKNSAKSFSWAVDASLGDKAVYGLVFKLESNPSVFQYSNPFHIKASGSKTSGSATVTLTKSTGVKTVTLASTSTAVSTTSSAVAKSSIVKHNTTTSYPTATASCNGTNTLVTKASNPVVVVTSTTLLNPTGTGTAPATVPTHSTAAAPIVSTGVFSVLSGLFVAFLAL